MRWAIASACAVTMCGVALIVLLCVGKPQITMGDVHYGRTLTLSVCLTEAEVVGARSAIAQSVFLRSVQKACPQDRELAETWTPQNTEFRLWRGLDGAIYFSYGVPSYSVRFFSVRDFGHHDDEAAFPELEAEVALRRRRIEEAIRGQIEGVLTSQKNRVDGKVQEMPG